jgi:hypothetical protein
MLKWMQKLDSKAAAMLEKMDEAAQPMTQVMEFEVFRRVDEDKAKAAHLLRTRQDAAGLDYEVPGASRKVAPEAKRNHGKACATCEMTPVTF